LNTRPPVCEEYRIKPLENKLERLLFQNAPFSRSDLRGLKKREEPEGLKTSTEDQRGIGGNQKKRPGLGAVSSKRGGGGAVKKDEKDKRLSKTKGEEDYTNAMTKGSKRVSQEKTTRSKTTGAGGTPLNRRKIGASP